MKEVIEMDKDEQEEYIGNGLLVNFSFVVILKGGKVDAAKSAEFCVTRDGDQYPSECSINGLKNMFQQLHSVLLPLSFAGEDGDESEQCEDEEKHTGGPTNLRELSEAVLQDGRLLPLLLYILCTGRSAYASSAELQDMQKQSCLFASAISSDLLLRAFNPSKYVGASTKVLSAQLELSSSSEYKEVLSRCGLTTSRRNILLTQAKQVVKGIQDSETEPLHPLEIDATSWDNLEQKDKSDGSVHSWTTGLHHRFHQHELETDTCKVYDSSGGNPLSRERKDWVQDIIVGEDRESTLNLTYRPRLCDNNSLCLQVLTHMQMTLKSLEYLPSVEECLAMITKKEFRTHKTGLPRIERVFEPSDIDKVIKELKDKGHVDMTRDDAILVDTIPSLWRDNDINSTYPIKSPFGSLSTITQCLDYVNRTGDAQVKRYEDGEEYLTPRRWLFLMPKCLPWLLVRLMRAISLTVQSMNQILEISSRHGMGRK
jgi:hypothetical protein